jgi:hypothetical protein
MPKSAVITNVRLSDEVWIIAALLHREHPGRKDFTISEIVKRAAQEGVCGQLRAGFRPHATLHCVANLPPNPGRGRMLYATGKHTRRLFRPGDDYHPDREGSDTTPNSKSIPSAYQDLLVWYDDFCSHGGEPAGDPWAEMFGSGKDLWADEKPDDYIRRMREGWE